MVALVALSALAVNVLHITAKVTNASTAADFVNEQRYNDVYQRDLTTIQTAAVPFAATATTPGVCGKGGTKQGCFDTGEKVIVDLRAMLTDLSRVSVPPRYLKADADLRKGLQLDIDALTLRDQAIATKDPNASFDASNQKGQQADALLHQAYGEFPADNAPKPPL